MARDRVTDRNTKRQSNAFKPLYHACSMGDQNDGSSGSDVVTVKLVLAARIVEAGQRQLKLTARGTSRPNGAGAHRYR